MAKAAGTKDFRDLTKKHADGKVDKPRAPSAIGNVDKQWWKKSGRGLADSVATVLEALKNAQSERLRQCVRSAILYGSFATFGGAMPYLRSTVQVAVSQATLKDRVSDNVTQSVIDTVTSKVGESKPRPYFLTSGGNYRQQRKAKKCNQFVDGTFYEQKTYDKGGLCFRDGAIWGDGFMHAFERNGKICHERVIPSEIWVDEQEAQYGYPRNLHRVKEIDREELAEHPDFAEHKAQILAATPVRSQYQSANNTISDMLLVAESWHLGTVDEKGKVIGGRHVITLPAEGIELLNEEWEFPVFPFAKLSWCPRPLGYWSQGLCEQLQGNQVELNKVLFLIQRSMHIAGTVKLLLKAGSKVAKESVNNEIGSVITYAGDTEPKFTVVQPVHQMYIEYTLRLRELMYAKGGTSELSAAGKKPAGLNSGAAQREFEDIQSDRFRTIQRYNEQFYVDIAALTIMLAQSMKSVKPVRVPGRHDFKQVDWKKDIGTLDESEYVLQCFPVSRLPKDPAGRLATIQEYIQAGFITPRQGRRAIDFPDLETIESLANAQEDLITKVLDDIIDGEDYHPPEPTDDLKLAKELVLEYIQRYRLLDLEDEKLDLLRNWNLQVDELLARTLTPATAAPMPGAPQAPPVPPQPSELVPNTPQQLAA